MTQQAFPYTTFWDSSGAPLVDGYVLLRLSQDAHSPNGLICGGKDVLISLDAAGVMESVPQVWPNSQLTPSGSSYIYQAYRADGQLAFGPESVTL